jgi:hypothetical protein
MRAENRFPLFLVQPGNRHEKSRRFHDEISGLIWLRGQDLNLGPSGYEGEKLR